MEVVKVDTLADAAKHGSPVDKDQAANSAVCRYGMGSTVTIIWSDSRPTHLRLAIIEVGVFSPEWYTYPIHHGVAPAYHRRDVSDQPLVHPQSVG